MNYDVKVPPHQRLTLDNGIGVVLLPRHDVPLLAFDAVMRGGASLDALGRAGAASLAAELLAHGAGERDAYRFADAVEGAGGNLEAGARADALIVHGQFLARDQQLMLELLADAIMRPRFDPAEVDKLRQRRIELIRATKDSEPQALLRDYGRALLFDTHPYGQPIGGSEASLAALGRDEVMRCYREQFGADRLTLVFAGDFDPADMSNAVARAFSSWGQAATAPQVLSAVARVTGRRVLLVDAPGLVETYFWIGNVGVAHDYPHRAALDVANTAYGGSFGSMLMQALRSKTGLTYSAGSGFRRGVIAGEFAITSSTQGVHTAKALDIALRTLGTLHRVGLSAGRVDSARSYLLGQYPLAFETAADWAMTLADMDLYGLGDDYINDFGPSLRRVDRAATAHVIDEAFPDPDNVDIVLLGDGKRIRSMAAQFGPVTEKPLSAGDFASLAASGY